MKKQHIAILVIVLVLVLGFLGKHKIKSMLMGSSTPTPAPVDQTAAAPTTTTSSSSAAASIITTQTGTKGSFLADDKGMTLYIFDKDTAGKSNCSAGCAVTWPPFMATGAATTLPTGVTTIKRADGSMQYAYKNLPLYYYAKDTKVGDVTGDGVAGIWHLVKP